MNDVPPEEMLHASPRIGAFLAGLGLPDPPAGTPPDAWLASLSETALHDVGLDREQLAAHLCLLLDATTAPADAAPGRNSPGMGLKPSTNAQTAAPTPTPTPK